MIWFHCQLKRWRNNSGLILIFFERFQNCSMTIYSRCCFELTEVSSAVWNYDESPCAVLTSLSIWWSNISGHDSHIETVSILLNMLKFRKYPRNVFLTTPSDMEWRCVNNSDPWLKIFDGHAIKNLYSPSPANDKVSRELSWILVHKNCFCISSQLTILLHQLSY